MLASALAPISEAQDRLWTVDDDGPADFSDLQAAVDTALDGDVILMQPGTYGSLILKGKGVSIIADGSGDVVLNGLARISGTPPNSKTVLYGLKKSAAVGSILDMEGLRVSNCLGTVHIEACSFDGGELFPLLDVFYGGILVMYSEDVRLVRNQALGGCGANLIRSNAFLSGSQ